MPAQDVEALAARFDMIAVRAWLPRARAALSQRGCHRHLTQGGGLQNFFGVRSVAAPGHGAPSGHRGWEIEFPGVRVGGGAGRSLFASRWRLHGARCVHSGFHGPRPRGIRQIGPERDRAPVPFREPKPDARGTLVEDATPSWGLGLGPARDRSARGAALIATSCAKKNLAAHYALLEAPHPPPGFAGWLVTRLVTRCIVDITPRVLRRSAAWSTAGARGARHGDDYRLPDDAVHGTVDDSLLVSAERHDVRERRERLERWMAQLRRSRRGLCRAGPGPEQRSAVGAMVGKSRHGYNYYRCLQGNRGEARHGSESSAAVTEGCP